MQQAMTSDLFQQFKRSNRSSFAETDPSNDWNYWNDLKRFGTIFLEVVMALKTFGLMGVDWEERVDLERLRRERLARIKNALKASEMGALLCFDMNNIRYITATHIGTWAMDKLVRFSLLPQDDEPIIWDFGSAARHHQIYCPWLGERSRAGISTLRGATHPGSGLAEDVAKKIKTELEMRKLVNEPRRRRRDRIARPVCLASSGNQSRRRPAVHARG